MNISDFDYYLPKELIAQFPLRCRDESRLLIIERKRERIIHSNFKEIVNLLEFGDALILNNAKVKPVRLIGKIGPKAIDILLVERVKKNHYLVKAKPAAKLKPGVEVSFDNGNLKACVNTTNPDEHRGLKLLEFDGDQDLELRLDEFGLMPLPPYIKRPVEDRDRLRYQTVYAACPGAIASPTAGLHFTRHILEDLEKKGIEIVQLTLNVGLGTFTPVRVDDITKHKMHKEYFDLPKGSAQKLEEVKKKKGRICAVGTTACRVIESCAQKVQNELKMSFGQGWTELFIYPRYEFKATDMLLTNFHLPRTTLLMLVSALVGKDLLRYAYEEAIKKRYRFYSYGDCMLIR